MRVLHIPYAGGGCRVDDGVDEDECAPGESERGEIVGRYGERASVDTDVGGLGASQMVNERDLSLGSSDHEEQERDALAWEDR